MAAAGTEIGLSDVIEQHMLCPARCRSGSDFTVAEPEEVANRSSITHLIWPRPSQSSSRRGDRSDSAGWKLSLRLVVWVAVLVLLGSRIPYQPLSHPTKLTVDVSSTEIKLRSVKVRNSSYQSTATELWTRPASPENGDPARGNHTRLQGREWCGRLHVLVEMISRAQGKSGDYEDPMSMSWNNFSGIWSCEGS